MHMLQQSITHLQFAVDTMDVSSSVYQAFFKGVDPSVVKGYLQNIIDGAEFVSPTITEPPSLICATEDNPYWATCEKLGIPGMWPLDTPFILLCPEFFNGTMNPFPAPHFCNTFNQAGTGLVGYDIWYTQYGVLVHELLHLYLGTAFMEPEVYDVNDCIALPASQSVTNPQSYAYYVTSKWIGISASFSSSWLKSAFLRPCPKTLGVSAC